MGQTDLFTLGSLKCVDLIQGVELELILILDVLTRTQLNLVGVAEADLLVLVVPKLIGLDEGILHPAEELVVPVEPLLLLGEVGSPVLPLLPESEEVFDE